MNSILKLNQRGLILKSSTYICASNGSSSTSTSNKSIIRGYAKKNSMDDVDTRPDTQKILEKFDIPRIIDLGDEEHDMLKHLKWAQKRISQREAKEPARAASKYKDNYKMMASVIIERFPSLFPEPTEYEQQYLDAEMRLQQFVNRKPLRMIDICEDLPEFQVVDTKEKKDDRSGEVDDSELGDLKASVEKQKRDKQMQEQEEEEGEYEEDFSKFVPESRETDADKKNDRRSLERKLDKSLYLIVKRPNGEWQFPSTIWIDGESMKNAAERALRDTTGENWTYWIPSQAPAGVHKVILGEKEQSSLQAEGVKNFFYRSHYFKGELDINKKFATDYHWIAKEEMKKYFSKNYFDQAHKLIFDDCYYNYIND
ncbi:hypothetical protein DFA_10057 [Cavenderia fasciculata]|uniref:Large ribosomal subunit protein mL46 n=1 Tax=Cavenderia fasciculata TaxID=261658 RepID=F4Q958_CACFS|nr:uncharacterized protein DFA_10057 [Cavenderia fasciculata]EGG15227.1 hypothetical protein DFA_10057 [Cavenderia fasciculata]|eukprot:XP_004351947.1 hypothetical protein DFA_10057 [Cavenderia fasciculata]